MTAKILGQSVAIQALRDHVQCIASHDAPVLILGESGTGKELIAEALHELSPRAKKPFVRLNCAAIPDALLESELFGHERGAFTGAHTQVKGKFEQANGGTIFLDEIGELPIGLQPKLLRVLQEGTFERIGGKTIQVDVRLVTATNRDLREEILAKRFREDLFYRIAVLPAYSPPLRSRKEDIPILANAFLFEFKPQLMLSIAALTILSAYDYPGNVRELRNIIQRIAVIARDEVVEGDVVTRSLAMDRLYGWQAPTDDSAPKAKTPQKPKAAPIVAKAVAITHYNGGETVERKGVRGTVVKVDNGFVAVKVNGQGIVWRLAEVRRVY